MSPQRRDQKPLGALKIETCVHPPRTVEVSAKGGDVTNVTNCLRAAAASGYDEVSMLTRGGSNGSDESPSDN